MILHIPRNNIFRYFDDINAKLVYFCLGSSKIYWIQASDQHNALVTIEAAPISNQVYIMGYPCFAPYHMNNHRDHFQISTL